MKHEITPKRARILVADDEEFNRLLLARMLDRDYDVDFAVNGQDALDKLDQCEYDAVLLDVMMPILNGIDTLKIIRQNADLATLPVIIISALSDRDTMVEGIELGANDYIPKPIDPSIVLARLNTQVALKQMMDERKMVSSALEKANEMKLRMMQIASHDLKNPLNNLALLMNVVKEICKDNGQMPNLMNIAYENIDTMVQIIDDFLSGKAFVQGDESVKTEIMSGTSLLNGILKQYELAAEEKNIAIRLENIDNQHIVADEARLKQVVTNLVSNAIKYSPCDSTVTIRAFQDESMWRLEIQDSGPGIPENERQYLFQAFSKHQISTKPTNGESSTGLGLWIAAEMMRAQNGMIGMDSPPSGGCCFWIEVPLAEESLFASA